MNKNVVGLQPWLPEFLQKNSWWTTPVRAEGLAALRIGVALVLLFDVFATYMPHWRLYFAPGGLGGPEVFGERLQWPYAHFSFAPFLPADTGMYYVLWATAFAAVGILLGCGTRFFAVLAWMLTYTLMNENYAIHNGGDRVRLILLFALIFAPSDATWSLAAYFRRDKNPGPVYIYPWALRLLFLQLIMLYFMNGVYKVIGPGWLAGNTLYYVSHDVMWARWSPDILPIPYFVTRLITWFVLAWELAFPLLVMNRRSRPWALAFGAAFHIGSGIAMNIGMFPIYALCLYLPELPLAAWRDRWSTKLGWSGRAEFVPT